MKKKASERVEKQIQQAKDFGTYVPSMRKELVRGEVALTRGKRPSSEPGKRVLDKGIIGSVGRLRHGVMKVSKKIIESVENRGGGGGGRRGRNGHSSNKGMRLSY